MSTTQTPAATGTATTTGTRTTWSVDAAHTLVEFAVKHMMIATVKGRFTDVQGTVVMDEANPDRSSVDVTIQASSLDTRNEQRDTHLRSPDFFGAEQFPTVRFVSKRIEGAGSQEFKLVGDLTVRDVTRELTLTVTDEGRGKDPWGGTRAGFSATGKLNRKDFGLLWNAALETGGVLVGDEVKISVEVELVKQG